MNSIEKLKNSNLMTTVDIAELTSKDHKHIMRDTKIMLIDLYGEKSLPRFGQSYVARNRQTYNCYNLPKNEVMVLISGYSIKLRMNVIKRLEQLENNHNIIPQLPDFTNPAIAARAWADEVEQKQIAETQCIKLEETIQTQEPKMVVYDRIALADGNFNLTETSKQLNERLIDLKKWILTPYKWIYKRDGSKHWLAYSDKLQQGLLEHKTTTIDCSGVERIHTQVRVTPKGLIKLANMLNEIKDKGLF